MTLHESWSTLWVCHLTGTPPSLLLHPLGFLGCGDTQDLFFFPAMRQFRERKIALVDRSVSRLAENHDLVALRHTRGIAGTSALSFRGFSLPHPG